MQDRLGEALHIFNWAVDHGTGDNVTCNSVFGQADDILLDNLCNGAALAGGAMLQDVLEDIVAVLMPAQRSCISQHFIDYLLCLLGCAVLYQALENTTTEAVTSNLEHLILQLCQNKLDSFWRHDLDELLKDMICMRRLHSLSHLPMHMLQQLLLVNRCANVKGFL